MKLRSGARKIMLSRMSSLYVWKRDSLVGGAACYSGKNMGFAGLLAGFHLKRWDASGVVGWSGWPRIESQLSHLGNLGQVIVPLDLSFLSEKEKMVTFNPKYREM